MIAKNTFRFKLASFLPSSKRPNFRQPSCVKPFEAFQLVSNYPTHSLSTTLTSTPSVSGWIRPYSTHYTALSSPSVMQHPANNDFTKQFSSPPSTSVSVPKRFMVSFATSSGVMCVVKGTGIVPDVWSKEFVPSVPMLIYWSDVELNKDGLELKPSDVQTAPSLSYIPPDHAAHYTIAKVDPDAPSRQEPKFREWRHWLMLNIPGADLSKGHTVSAYMGPAPPSGTGLHRYVFLLFKQPGVINIPPIQDDGMNRANFKIQEFANQHNLGDPIGCAHFLAQHQ